MYNIARITDILMLDIFALKNTNIIIIIILFYESYYYYYYYYYVRS